MKRLRALAAVLAVTAVAAPVASAAAPPVDEASAALLALQTQDRRVLAIGWRLTESMADLCPAPRPGLGWTLHNPDQYRPGLRPSVQTAFGLETGRLGVLALAPDGPAARAGVREGDVLLTVGQARFEAQTASAQADHGPLARALSRIANEVSTAPLPVRVRRGQRTLDLIVQPRLHCDWPVQVETSSRLFAAADGTRVSVSSALADHAARDDDLAFLIAHELAHNLRRPSESGTRRGSRAREVEADRIGLILAARAGYDTSGAGAFMRAMGRRTGPRLPRFDGHPPTAERAAALDRLHLWIAAERRAGRPLRP